MSVDFDTADLQALALAYGCELADWQREQPSASTDLDHTSGDLLLHHSPEPPYRQIAAWLRGRIEAGEFRPGEDPLLSEKDLQEYFEVSRDTTRRAVAVLREEGLVVTVPQRGTYVKQDG